MLSDFLNSSSPSYCPETNSLAVPGFDSSFRPSWLARESRNISFSVPLAVNWDLRKLGL